MVPRNHKPEAELARALQLAAKQVKVGAQYAHYKNPDLTYVVVGHVILEATDEPAIMYQAQYGKKITYARALSIWLETVEWQGKTVPRFVKIKDS
jgi:hypothetical protein